MCEECDPVNKNVCVIDWLMSDDCIYTTAIKYSRCNQPCSRCVTLILQSALINDAPAGTAFMAQRVSTRY